VIYLFIFISASLILAERQRILLKFGTQTRSWCIYECRSWWGTSPLKKFWVAKTLKITSGACSLVLIPLERKPTSERLRGLWIWRCMAYKLGVRP